MKFDARVFYEGRYLYLHKGDFCIGHSGAFVGMNQRIDVPIEFYFGERDENGLPIYSEIKEETNP